MFKLDEGTLKRVFLLANMVENNRDLEIGLAQDTAPKIDPDKLKVGDQVIGRIVFAGRDTGVRFYVDGFMEEDGRRMVLLVTPPAHPVDKVSFEALRQGRSGVLRFDEVISRSKKSK